MDQVTWIVVIALATLVSGASLLTRADEALWGLASLLLWLVAAYGATNVEIYSGGQLAASKTYPGLALLFGAGGGGLMLIVWLKGAAMAIHPDKTQGELREPSR